MYMANPGDFNVGDHVECLAFDNAMGNWRGCIVTGKRRASLKLIGTNWCTGSNANREVAMFFVHMLNLLTCFVCKQRCCPDTFIYSVKYPGGREEFRVPNARLRTPLTAEDDVPLTAIEVVAATAVHHVSGVSTEAPG